MKFNRPLLASLAGLGLALWPAARARAQAPIGPSPFLPPGVSGSAGGAGDDSGTLQLRGIMSTPQGPRYCIYDPTRKASMWSAVDEPGFDFVVRSGDPSRRTVLVESGGRTVRLELQEAKIGASAVLSGPAIALSQFGRRGNGAALSPAEEAARLQAVAEEVRRRREQREQNALEQGGGGPPPAYPRRDYYSYP